MLKKVAFIIYCKKYIQIENPGSHLAFSNFAVGGGVHVDHNAMMHAYRGGAILVCSYQICFVN